MEATAFSADGQRVAAGGFDVMMVVYELPGLKVAQRLGPHGSPIQGVAFSPQGDRLATASGLGISERIQHTGRGDQAVRLWSLEGRGRVVNRVELRGKAMAVAFAPDGASFAVATSGGRLYLMGGESGEQLLEFHGVEARFQTWDATTPAHSGSVRGVAFSHGRLWSGSGGGLPRKHGLRGWDPESGRELHQVTHCPHSFDGLAVAPDDRRIVVWQEEAGRFEVWQLPE